VAHGHVRVFDAAHVLIGNMPVQFGEWPELTAVPSGPCDGFSTVGRRRVDDERLRREPEPSAMRAVISTSTGRSVGAPVNDGWEMSIRIPPVAARIARSLPSE